MDSPDQKKALSQLPHLPDELWLQILSHLDWLTLWQTIRAVHPRLRTEVDDLAIKQLLPSFTMALTYTLGSGTRHRWYDIRATITLSFASMNKHNPDFALFKVSAIDPPNFHDRGLEKWRSICAQSAGSGLDWLLTYGDGVDDVCRVKLHKLVAAEDGALWCDWRELLGRCFQRGRTQVEREEKARIEASPGPGDHELSSS